MKKACLFIGIVVFIFVVKGYFNTEYTKTEQTKNAATITSNKSIDLIKAQINKMSLDEKIGQLVIVGIEGTTVNSNSINMIKNKKVGGVILFGNNVKNSNQLLSLTNGLKAANSKNQIPLFISVDQEGGSVDRMSNIFKKIPNNSAIGRKNNNNLSSNIGNIIGKEVKSFGFNIDFAPVLDINSNPKNPVIGSRSFGNNPKIVSDLGIHTMKGIQSAGVIPVIKHFPGHGDTSVDSHIGLPVVYNDLNRLNKFEFIPFSNAIKNKADMVMIAHILLPKIDNKNPSSFSKIIITDILRNKLGFGGVVITDDMTMGAIIKNYNIGNVAVKAVNAGSDIVLVAHNNTNQLLVIDALKKAVNNKVISEERLNESVYRILKLKRKYNLNDKKTNSVNIDEINNRISSILKNYFNVP